MANDLVTLAEVVGVGLVGLVVLDHFATPQTGAAVGAATGGVLGGVSHVATGALTAAGGEVLQHPLGSAVIATGGYVLGRRGGGGSGGSSASSTTRRKRRTKSSSASTGSAALRARAMGALQRVQEAITTAAPISTADATTLIHAIRSHVFTFGEIATAVGGVGALLSKIPALLPFAVA